MDKKQAKAILEELHRRAGARARLSPDKILFGPQKAFVADDSKMKIAVCSRRAGKSFSVAYMLTESALKFDREIIPYITLTRDTAKNILWPAMHAIDKQLEIGLKFHENTGDIVFPNKARIVLRGCDDRNQIEKLRGPRYPRVVIDEAQAFPSFLEELIDDVLEPATIDFKGQIIVTGTPNASCRGVFYEMAEGELKGAWSQHNWTLRENPHLGDVGTWLNNLRKRRGWTEQHPTFLREYCGKWVRDTNGLVYKISPELNSVWEWEPENDLNWSYVLGIDLGFNDPTAFAVVAYNDRTGECVVVSSYKEAGLIPSAVAVRVERLMEEYEFDRIVADSGGFGKGYVEEMRSSFEIPVHPADKKDKVGFIELLNGDLQSGATKVVRPANTELWDELTLLQWKMDSLDRGKYIEDRKRFQNHLCDAVLYAWKECKHHMPTYDINGPTIGSKQWWREEEDRMERLELDRLDRAMGAPWWDDGAEQWH